MVRQRILMAALCVVAAMTGFAQQPAANSILPFNVTEKTLDNGLKVIVVPTGFPNIVSVQIPVQTGSRNEVEPGKSGFAHFFEHMMFRGTKAYPPDVYNSIITKAGARQNAFTSNDLTNFHVTFAKEDLEKILEIEADRFKNLSYSEAAFKTEARAVLGEYNKNSANPIQKLDEAQHEAAYTTHTYKHTTMGFIKDIEDMPNQYEYSKTFFSRWYRPEKVTIIVAGDVDPNRVIALVQKYWGDWQRGTFSVDIPQEPQAKGPVYEHVAWQTPTLPWVTVAFHGPSFFQMKDYAAIDTMLDLQFGETSDLYKRLVQDEQKVDAMFADAGPNFDPGLITVYARIKDVKDAPYVRDEILKTFAAARDRKLDAQRVEDAKSSTRYGFVRRLDNTEAIASTIARFAYFERSFDTINKFYNVYSQTTPDDIQAAARKYVTDANMVITDLSTQPMPEAEAKLPSVDAMTSAAPAMANGQEVQIRFIQQKSVLPNVMFKLLFTVGSANDPKGKEGLAQLAASMITEAGSKSMRVDEIQKALFPIAGSFGSQVDKEMTTLTGVVHKDNLGKFLDVVLPQLLTPGFRDEDFQRLKDQQLNELQTDLRSANDEELGKEQLQNVLFDGTPYGHTPLGTIAGLQSITLDDVKKFIADNYKATNVVVGLSGDFPDSLVQRLKTDLGQLGAGATTTTIASLPAIVAKQPQGLQIQIVKKDTRATAISLGTPIPVTREDSDFAALNLARVWLGEHRASSGRLYDRIRETRGLNYGDYAYVEFFNRPGQQFFPSPNIARRSQLFEVWIRPVVPVNAQMALRIALYETQKMIDNGLSQEDFDKTRDYVMKNVFLLTSTQNQSLGYALDSWWYGTPEYTDYMRAQYAKLTRDQVNRAIKKYFSAKNLQIVIVTKDAEGLRDALLSDAPTSIKYDAPKPELAEEDKVIGSYKLNLKPENVRIVSVDEVFAK
ncbi:MAG: insulinase family protein [Acidobacteria bacterium]|nr:insulinase family protein [Acidobacteriota bacterium]MBV9476182.1 insulinase family protein [Acidobacteriota bacterium]